MCEPPWKPFPELNVRDKLERRQRVPTHAQSVLCGSHPRARGCHTPSQKPKARAQHGHPWSHRLHWRKLPLGRLCLQKQRAC